MTQRNPNAKRPSPSQNPPRNRTEDLFADRYPPRPETGPPEVVDPRWLLKAAALALGAALLCAYASLCLLVYQGQWQLLLHPIAGAPPAVDASQQLIRFGATTTGQPELVGIWLPASNPSPATPTLLYLPDGSGNLAADTDALRALHALPVNLFALDYRGFGASTPSSHPSEARMREDAESAFSYLVNTRHLAPGTVVPYGVGLGGSLATSLSARHPELPAVILEAPRPDAASLALADSRAKLVPLRWFLHERFTLLPDLSSLRAPKLLLDAGPSSVSGQSNAASFTQLSHSAADPVMTVHLATANGPSSPALWRASILRFLDEYLVTPPSDLGAHP